MKMLLVATLTAVSFSASAFELKGISLGDSMSECPNNGRLIAEQNIPGGTTCEWDVATFAGEPARGGFLTFLNGRVVTLYISLKSSGRYANRMVLDAMIEKFGRPSNESKPHINEYRWTSQRGILTLDGWNGSILAMDYETVRRAQTEAAKKSKNDM